MKRDTIDLTTAEILVDLQTGAISVVLPLSGAETLELETVTPEDEFAPQE